MRWKAIIWSLGALAVLGAAVAYAVHTTACIRELDSRLQAIEKSLVPRVEPLAEKRG